jgi:hypothetical protein
MKSLLTFLLALVICSPAAVARAESKSSAAPLPGQEIATTVSTITGVAISPLIGVSAIGAYQWWKAKTPEARARLPWFAHPGVWIPCFLLAGACFVKDTAGTALPTVAKKPLDVADAVENKISGLIAMGAFVPIAAAIFTAKSGDGASLGALGYAGVDLSWFYNALMIPISMAAFAVVFLASNAINILILLSPFTTVDAALKAFRGALLASVVGTAWANPWLGLCWALILVLFAWLIAGWSFRLSHFGTVFLWDILTFRRYRFTPNAIENPMFLSRKIAKVPARTYGRVSSDAQGNLVMNYRPWLVLPKRTLTLPPAKYALGKAVFYLNIHEPDGDKTRSMFTLPPRYRDHEDELVKIYNLDGVQPAGMRAAWAWLRGAFGVETKPATA